MNEAKSRLCPSVFHIVYTRLGIGPGKRLECRDRCDPGGPPYPGRRNFGLGGGAIPGRIAAQTAPFPSLDVLVDCGSVSHRRSRLPRVSPRTGGQWRFLTWAPSLPAVSLRFRAANWRMPNTRLPPPPPSGIGCGSFRSGSRWSRTGIRPNPHFTGKVTEPTALVF
jgi:hypothetical protein